jgi:hypothetical protein
MANFIKKDNGKKITEFKGYKPSGRSIPPLRNRTICVLSGKMDFSLDFDSG